MVGKENTGGFRIPKIQEYPRLKGELVNEPHFKKAGQPSDPQAIKDASAKFLAALGYPAEDRPAELKKDRIDDPMLHARNLVWGIFYSGSMSIDDVYVVWYAYVLGGWKALISTNVKDNCYYEVTHNVAKNETYVDKYVKHQNICVDENTNRYI